MQRFQQNAATIGDISAPTSSTGGASSRATTISSQTLSHISSAGLTKGNGQGLRAESIRVITPVILNMPLQNVAGLSKLPQLKVFVGLGTAREYVASLEVALLKRFCSNYDECSQKTAGGSSVLVERADRQTMGWFLRWLSQGQKDPVAPMEGDIDERLRVCLARLYVFQRLGVILPSGKPEDTLMEEIKSLVNAMERLFSTHVKYVYEHFSDKRPVDYGQVFAAIIAKATLDGSLYGMKDKIYWKLPPFVLFEKNLRTHLLSQELLARVQRIQTFNPISTDLLGFLLRFSNQGSQLRGTLAEGLVRLEQSRKVANARTHCGDALLNTGFEVDLDAARVAWAKAHRVTANVDKSRAKPLAVDMSANRTSDKRETKGFAERNTGQLKAGSQKRSAGPDGLREKFTNALRRLHRERTRGDEAAKQQLQIDQHQLVGSTSQSGGTGPPTDVIQASYREEKTSDQPETKPSPATMAFSFGAETSAPINQDKAPVALSDMPMTNGPISYTNQTQKPRIVVRLPPPAVASEKKHTQASKIENHYDPNITRTSGEPRKITGSSGVIPLSYHEPRQGKPANTKLETSPSQTTRAAPIKAAIPLSFESKDK